MAKKNRSSKKNSIDLPVHRLVAKAFVPNPNGYRYIEHIDGNKLNNRADNLRWVQSGGDEEYVKKFLQDYINKYF